MFLIIVGLIVGLTFLILQLENTKFDVAGFGWIALSSVVIVFYIRDGVKDSWAGWADNGVIYFVPILYVVILYFAITSFKKKDD